MKKTTRAMLNYIQEREYIDMRMINNMGRKAIIAIYNNYRREERNNKAALEQK